MMIRVILEKMKKNTSAVRSTNKGFYYGIGGVLVRLTARKRLTNRLPKLSLATSFPKTAG